MPDASPLRVSWRSPAFVVIVAAACTAPLDVPLVSPALPAIRDAFGVSDAAAGLVITAYAAPALVSAPLIGMLADRFGRRRVLVVSLVGYGAFGTAVLAAPTFGALLALRVGQGAMGGSIIASIAMTVIGDRTTGTTRAAAMGVTTAVQSLAVALYPALGGALAGVDWRLPFAAYAASVVVGLAALVVLPREDVGGRATGLAYLRDAVAAVPHHRALVAYAALFGGFSLFFGGVLTAVPFLLGSAFGVGAGRIGALLTAALLVSAAVAWANGRLVRRFGERRLVGFGFLAYGVGLVASATAPTLGTLVVGLAVFGVGQGLTMPSLATVIAGLGPARVRAGVMSLRTSTVVASQAIAPGVFATVGPVVGYRVALLAAGVAALVAAVGGLAVLRAERARDGRAEG